MISMSENKHHISYPLDKKIKVFNYCKDDFESFWGRMMDPARDFYHEPNERLASDAGESLGIFAKGIIAQQGMQDCIPYLKLGRELIHAHYTLAFNPDQPFTFSLRDKEMTLMGKVTDAKMMMDDWLYNLCVCITLRDWDTVQTMCRYISKEHTNPGVGQSLFDTAMSEFMKGLFNADADIRALLQEVMVTSDPEYITESRQPYIYNLYLPMVNAMIGLLSGDEARYQETMTKAIQDQYEFYKARDEHNYKAYVSMYLCAVGAMAFDQKGWTIPDSPYLPKWLVYGEFDIGL